MEHALRRTLTGINLHVMCSCGLKRWQAAHARGRKAIAQTIKFVSTCPSGRAGKFQMGSGLLSSKALHRMGEKYIIGLAEYKLRLKHK